MFDKVMTAGAAVIIGILAVAFFIKDKELQDLQLQLEKERTIALEKSLSLEQNIEKLRIQNEKENKEAAATISDLRARIQHGVRLPRVQTMPADTRAEDRKDGCDLDPGAGAIIIGIAERGDKAIRALNQCIDSYNAIRNSQQ